jgi:hypothetical protein
MLLPCLPYCTQQTGVLTRGLTLRENITAYHQIQGAAVGNRFPESDGPQGYFVVTVRGYRSDLGLFAAWYDGPPLEKLTASVFASSGLTLRTIR